MAPSFDCVSSLLCSEDSTVFDESHYGGTMMGVCEDTWRPRRHRFDDDDDEPDELPLLSDECLAMMVERECQLWPGLRYFNSLQTGILDSGARKEAIDWIHKVRSHFGFGPLCGYLSINYLDRFLSAYELPKGRVWTMQLLAVACLSLAAKVDETEVPVSLDLQVGESKFVFEAKTIQRMELLVLSTLKWRMQSITPFTFIDYFLCKINGDQSPLKSAIMRSIQLISSTAIGIDFLEFKPSEIAAAVAMNVMGETQTVDTGKAISVLIQHVEKERLLKCIKMMKELSSNSGSAKDSSGSVTCLPQSPIGVLDALCFSHKSDDTNAASCANSSHSTPDAKRRKLNKTCGAELL
ncbi:cyclin-D4-1-like [Vigna unguiculata]|uniref:B-like cyclin n=1 Tax=Vigna unguiculata TaxID=3917 RepID=A0A4D6NQ43_VIGUN|nr:cyclin-D4-1-like [Vigna unguiculata]QCE15963.1 cyclin D3 [Vigna unguiculata]